eukprot:296256-Pleurochrysis_carterae.AAC.4
MKRITSLSFANVVDGSSQTSKKAAHCAAVPRYETHLDRASMVKHAVYGQEKRLWVFCLRWVMLTLAMLGPLSAGWMCICTRQSR